MKYQIIFYLFVGILFFAPTKSAAQTNVFIETKTSNQTFSITDNGKLYFESGNLVINENGQSTTSVSLSDIKKITFKAEGSSIAEDQIDGSLSIAVYPNPAENEIHLANVEFDKANIEIFSSIGKLVLKSQVNGAEPIDISSLSSGIYFLKVNGQTVKIIKR